eukprot:2841201-Rhodomonas_salina.1
MSHGNLTDGSNGSMFKDSAKTKATFEDLAEPRISHDFEKACEPTIWDGKAPLNNGRTSSHDSKAPSVLDGDVLEDMLRTFGYDTVDEVKAVEPACARYTVAASPKLTMGDISGADIEHVPSLPLQSKVVEFEANSTASVSVPSFELHKSPSMQRLEAEDGELLSSLLAPWGYI